MNWLDVVIIILLGIGLIKGFIDGLVIELTEILALVLGIFLAIHFSGWTAARLSDYFDLQTKWLGIMAFAITFIIIVISVNLLGRLLDNVLKAASLGFILRITGAIFGVIKVVLILSVVFVFINTLSQKIRIIPEKTASESTLYRPIADVIPEIFPIVEGGDLLDSFNRYKKDPESQPI